MTGLAPARDSSHMIHSHARLLIPPTLTIVNYTTGCTTDFPSFGNLKYDTFSGIIYVIISG